MICFRGKRSAAQRSSQSGQGLVEFAIALPIFALAVFGLLDVGRLVYTNSALSQAAREGARLAATEAARIGDTGGACVTDASMIGAGNPGAFVCPVDAAAFKADVVEAVNSMAVSLGPIAGVHIRCSPDSASIPSGSWTESGGSPGDGCTDLTQESGELVSVRVEYTYQPITPVISSLLGALPLSGSATMVIH